MKPILIFLLSILLLLSIYLLYSRYRYSDRVEVEGLTSIYDSVKNATDSQAMLINTLQDAIVNNPDISKAVKNLPDGGAGIIAKTKAAVTASNDALLAAQNYK